MLTSKDLFLKECKGYSCFFGIGLVKIEDCDIHWWWNMYGFKTSLVVLNLWGSCALKILWCITAFIRRHCASKFLHWRCRKLHNYRDLVLTLHRCDSIILWDLNTWILSRVTVQHVSWCESFWSEFEPAVQTYLMNIIFTTSCLAKQFSDLAPHQVTGRC
jgi:hypothetical protein